MKYSVPGVMGEEIIYESGIVSQFLCDSYPSHLLPETREDPTAPLRRARINFFVDTWTSKLSSPMMNTMKAPDAEKEEKCREWAAIIEKEIEPLLADAGPFFGGSKQLTFAEVMVAPFLLRWIAHSADGELIPKSFEKTLGSLPNFGKWAQAVKQHPSVLGIWDEQTTIEGFKRKMKKMMADRK